MTWTGFTIDAATTVDRDDAIWVESTEAGVELSVFVTLLDIRKDCEADLFAHERLETLYRGRGNTYMLNRWAQEQGSLDRGKKRTVLRVRVLMLDTGEITQPRIDHGEFESTYQFAYPDIPDALTDQGAPHHAQLTLLARVCRLLLELRRTQGALAFYDLNHGWVSTEEGHIHQLKNIDATIGHVIVQEMMILANCVMATEMAKGDVPVLFRNHTARGHAPPHAEILQQLDNAYSDPTRLDAVRERIHLMMNKATYGSQLDGHFGLNVPAYVHATSPLRRYADLVTQRQIAAVVRGEEPPYTRQEITDIGEHITTRLLQRREATSDWFRSRADEKAERRMGNARTLTHIEPKDFERALKVAVGSEMPSPAFVLAYLKRLERGLLTPANLMVALFRSPLGAGWDHVRERSYEVLTRSPHIGTAVINAAQQAGILEKLEVVVTGHGEDHDRSYLARGHVVRDGNTFRVAPANSRTKKLARHIIHVGLIGQVLGLQG